MGCRKCNKKSKKSNVQVGQSVDDIMKDKDEMIEKRKKMQEERQKKMLERVNTTPIADLPVIKRVRVLAETHPKKEELINELKKIIEENSDD